MKNLIVMFSLLYSLNTSAGITVISDLDDTIKITNAGDEVEATRRGILSDDVFTGMPEFLQSLKSYVNEIHVLSASPRVLKPKIELTFKKKGIEVNSIILKNPLERQSVLAYKVEQIKKLMEKNSGDDFILIGDDVDRDPEIYHSITKEYPNRVIGSYIRAVRNREVPSSQTKYWTSYDLHLREFQANRMGHSYVTQSNVLLLSELRMNLIIPHFADCPKVPASWLWQLGTRFSVEAGLLMAKINTYCLVSRSGILAF